MCFVFQHFGPTQVPRWGPPRPVLVPSSSRAFLPGSGLDGPKQTSWPLPKIRKSVMSIKFPPAILGPEMAAPILWAPGTFWFFLLENPNAHKIPPVRGGIVGFLEGGGGGSANFIFMGVGIFPRKTNFSTPNMTGRTFHRTMEMIPRPPLVV